MKHRKIVEVVQLAWKWADESGRWPNEIPRARKIEMVRSAPPPVVAPTWKQMDAAVHQCRGWHKKVAIILRYTGLRVSEVMLLKWEDINLQDAMLTIRAEISKNGVGRIIPVTPHLIREMSLWDQSQDWVIASGRKKSTQRHRQARARDFARAWERAGVSKEAKNQPTHAFRKGWKSGMLALNAHPDAVDFLQGHVLGRGSRSRYIDPWTALPLIQVVGLVPVIQ